MPQELTFISAVLIGLLGSGHCIGMCGGIVTALNMGSGDPIQPGTKSIWRYQLAYNLGRISSYILIGALAGALGSGFTQLGITPNPLVGRMFATLFMIALGLYLTGWWRGLAILEKAGFFIWRYIQPLSQRVLPISTPGKALLMGMLWGWLPCGLVYAVVAWSLTTGSPAEGALMMLGFGLGTLPSMLLAGSSLTIFKSYIKTPMVKTLSGVIIIALGLYSAVGMLDPMHQHHHSGDYSPIDYQATRVA